MTKYIAQLQKAAQKALDKAARDYPYRDMSKSRVVEYGGANE